MNEKSILSLTVSVAVVVVIRYVSEALHHIDSSIHNAECKSIRNEHKMEARKRRIEYFRKSKKNTVERQMSLRKKLNEEEHYNFKYLVIL